MSRVTGLAYIEKLQAQIDAAKQKEAEKAAKKAQQAEEKAAELKGKIADENTKFEKRIEQVTEAHNDRVAKLQSQIDALTSPEPVFSQVELEVVSDDSDAGNVA